MNEIEIYVRASSHETRLVIHASPGVGTALLETLKTNAVTDRSHVIHLELTALPEWVTDEDERKALRAIGPVHVRIPISELRLQEHDLSP